MLKEVKNNHFHYFVDTQGNWHGEFKQWAGKGYLCEHSFYNNGNLHGEYKRWWGNGQLEAHCFYVNGTKHGECKYYEKDGNMSLHCFYVNGRLVYFKEIPYPATPEERMMFVLKYNLPLLN